MSHTQNKMAWGQNILKKGKPIMVSAPRLRSVPMNILTLEQKRNLNVSLCTSFSTERQFWLMRGK